MITHPLISIIIPTYNQAQYLPKTLVSVLGQTWGDYEVIIGDNASTDGTKEIVEDFRRKDPRIVSFRNETTVTAHHNYNLCFRRASPESKYVVFLPSDDWWKPEFLSTVTAIAEQYPHVTVTHANGYRTDPFEQVINKYSDLWNDLPNDGFHQATRQLYRGNFIMFHAALINRRHLKDIYSVSSLFDPHLIYAADYDLWIQLFTRGAYGYYISDPLVYYRKHEAAHTTPQNTIPRLTDHVTIFRDRLANVCPPELEDSRQEALLINLKQLGFVLLAAGRKAEALPVLTEAHQLAAGRQLDVKVAARLAASPLPPTLAAWGWRAVAAGAQKVRQNP